MTPGMGFMKQGSAIYHLKMFYVFSAFLVDIVR